MSNILTNNINARSGNKITIGDSNDTVSIPGTLTYEDVSNVDSVGVITAQSDVVIADKIIHLGDTDTAIRFPAADTFTVETASDEALRVDSSQRLLVGTNSNRATAAGLRAKLQVEGTGGGANTTAISITQNSDDANPAKFSLTKTRSTAVGGVTAVVDDDNLGRIDFSGADGTDAITVAARIDAEVDGTPGSNDMPGRLVFFTTADNASSPTERLRITSDGQLELRKDQDGVTGRPDNRIIFKDTDTSVAANQPIGEISWYSTDSGMANVNSYIRGINEATNGSGALTFGVKASGSSEIEALRVTSTGNIGIGTNNPGRRFDIAQANSTAYSGTDFDQNYNSLRLRNYTDNQSVGLQFLIGSNGEAAITANETSDGSTQLIFGTRGGGARRQRFKIQEDGATVYYGNATTLSGVTASTRAEVSSGGTLDLEIPGTSVVGHLYVISVLTSNANSRTARSYRIALRLNNSPLITQEFSDNGGGGGKDFSISEASGGSFPNTLRFTDTSSSAVTVSMHFVGCAGL